jgi:hypothetical protein
MGTYRARAFWRGVENFNVGIHPDGITDWGASRPYTPIDLVMAANNVPYFEPAYEWLVKQTGYKPDEDDWTRRKEEIAARLIAGTQAKRERALAGHKPPAKPQVATDAPVTPAPPVRAPRGKMDPFTPGRLRRSYGRNRAMGTRNRPPTRAGIFDPRRAGILPPPFTAARP